MTDITPVIALRPSKRNYWTIIEGEGGIKCVFVDEPRLFYLLKLLCPYVFSSGVKTEKIFAENYQRAEQMFEQLSLDCFMSVSIRYQRAIIIYYGPHSLSLSLCSDGKFLSF